MKKILTIIALLTPTLVHSQIVILKTNLGNCIKCMLPIVSISPAKTGLPVYLSLPAKYANDDAEIQDHYGFKNLGFRTIYSDSVYDAIPSTSSASLSFVSSANEIVFTQDLVQFNVNNLDSMYETLHRNSIPFRASAVYKVGNNSFANFFELGKVASYTADRNFVYRIGEAQAKIARQLDRTSNKHDTLAYTFIQKTEGPSILPSVTGFNWANNRNVFVSIKYNTVTVDGKDTDIHVCPALAKFTDDIVSDIYPISMAQEFANTKRFVSSDFLAQKDSEAIFPTYDLSSLRVNSTQINEFLGLYKLRDNRYVFSQMLPIIVPDVYKQLLGPRFINLNYSDYPYLVLSGSTIVYNLETFEVFSPDIPEYPALDKIGEQLSKQSATTDPLFLYRNLSLSHEKNRDRLYLVTSISGKKYLQIIDIKTKQRLAKIYLEEVLYGADSTEFLAVDANSKNLYWADRKGNIASLPMSLFPEFL